MLPIWSLAHIIADNFDLFYNNKQMEIDFGKLVILIGFVFIITGIFILLVGKVPLIGKLPGDIYIRRDNFTLFFPIATCIIISIILSLIFWLFNKL